MIKQSNKLKNFYDDLHKKEKIPHKKALSIFEALHKQAMALRKKRPLNLKRDFKAQIRMAKILNSLRS